MKQNFKQKIEKSFGHRLIANNYTKRIIIETILLLPDDLINFVTKNCWFISSFEDGWAFVLKGDEIKRNEYLIFLSDELIKEGEEQMRYTILHEIGHVILGHRNSIGEVQSKAEVKKQEKEADEFVKNILSG